MSLVAVLADAQELQLRGLGRKSSGAFLVCWGAFKYIIRK